jgi:5-methylcytosine-specific restriction endonuclease McrA
LTETFVHPLHGVELLWEHEIVREVHADGRDYTWEAWVCVPVSHARQAGAVIWSPRFKERSELRKRTTQTYNRHLRRLRVQRATAERFDAREIFERDGWTCQLCGEAVESDLAWPDPGCASLDHVKPILAGGEHSRANTQLAHWLCNVRKGARYVEP